MPCEVCGGKAQAHHDSYYPDKWICVRWLCPKHHRHWHDHNEPHWPSIFEFHPTDHYENHSQSEDRGAVRHGFYTGKRGRAPRPWLRKNEAVWYICMKGKQIRLGKDREEAIRECHRLVEEAGRQSATPPESPR